jgi:hypothetical protein
MSEHLIGALLQAVSNKRFLSAFRILRRSEERLICEHLESYVQVILQLAEHGLISQEHSCKILEMVDRRGMPKEYSIQFSLFLLWILYLAGADVRRYSFTEIVELWFPQADSRLTFRQFAQYKPELISSNWFLSFLPKPVSLNLLPNAGVHGKVTLLFSANPHYFLEKFLRFNRHHLEHFDPRILTVHINLIDPDLRSLEELSALSQLPGIQASVSSSNRDWDSEPLAGRDEKIAYHHQHTFYASNRFMIVPTILALNKTPVVVLDVDLEFPKGLDPLGEFYLNSPDYDIGIRAPKRRRAPGFDYWLHESVYAPTVTGTLFASLFSRYLQFYFSIKSSLWTLDQCAFNAVRQYFKQTHTILKLNDLGTQGCRGHHGLTFHRGGRDQLVGLRSRLFSDH